MRLVNYIISMLPSKKQTLANKYRNISDRANIKYLQNIGIFELVEHAASQGKYNVDYTTKNVNDVKYINNMCTNGFKIDIAMDGTTYMINISWNRDDYSMLEFIQI